MSERFHFEHTFQTLQEHHFIREGFSNDFAHWAFAACNEIGLAERLAAIDVREFTSISDLRNRLVAIVEDYLKHNPSAPDRAALEPFYFCATDTVVIPTPFVARNLVEFIESLKKVSIHSIHHHYIDARLRIKLNSNDFSMWLEKEMDLGPLADRLNRIDIYTSTLYDVHDQIVRILERAADPGAGEKRKIRWTSEGKPRKRPCLAGTTWTTGSVAPLPAALLRLRRWSRRENAANARGFRKRRRRLRLPLGWMITSPSSAVRNWMNCAISLNSFAARRSRW